MDRKACENYTLLLPLIKFKASHDRLTVNIMNKQSYTTDKEWSFSQGAGASTSAPDKISILWKDTQALDLVRFFRTK